MKQFFRETSKDILDRDGVFRVPIKEQDLIKIAEKNKAFYDAHIAAGFTEDMAFTILIETIKNI